MRMYLADFRIITQQQDWQSQATLMLNQLEHLPETISAFGTHWIEAGHHIRSQLNDDKILAQLLRHVLPAYEGQALDLFRGENIARWQCKDIGFAWTSDKEMAKMFGRGLNAIDSGGVLLHARLKPEAIITGPNRHSIYLGEAQYTIDPSMLKEIETIEFYPPIH